MADWDEARFNPAELLSKPLICPSLNRKEKKRDSKIERKNKIYELSRHNLSLKNKIRTLLIK